MRVHILNNVKGVASGKVRLRLPEGWTATPSETPFTFTHEGERQHFTFRLSMPRVAPDARYTANRVRTLFTSVRN
jgi:hypothetical protein